MRKQNKISDIQLSVINKINNQLAQELQGFINGTPEIMIQRADEISLKLDIIRILPNVPLNDGQCKYLLAQDKPLDSIYNLCLQRYYDAYVDSFVISILQNEISENGN